MSLSKIPKKIFIKIVDNLCITEINHFMLTSKYYYKIIKPLKLQFFKKTTKNYLDNFYQEILLLHINDKYLYTNIDMININFYKIVIYEINTRNILKKFLINNLFKNYEKLDKIYKYLENDLGSNFVKIRLIN